MIARRFTWLFGAALVVLALAAGAWSIVARRAAPSISQRSELNESPDPRLGKRLLLPKLIAPDGHALDAETKPPAAIRVVAMLGVECPVAARHTAELARLHARYASKGVSFVGVFPNVHDTLDEIARFASEHRLAFPVGKDLEQETLRGWGARRVPEAYLFDAQGRLCYLGHIFGRLDRPAPEMTRASGEPQSESSTDDEPSLAAALADLVYGRAVRVAQTKAWGCLIGRAPRPNADSPVNFARDVAPIFAAHCQLCHRTGQIAPMPLVTYEECAPWAPMIREVTENRQMPPWGANPDFGHWVDDPTLSLEEIEIVRQWAEHGAVPGDLSQAPPPRTFHDGWALANPDLVLPVVAEPFAVPASGIVPYQNLVLAFPNDEDRWLTAVEARPDCRAVVHHMRVMIKPPGSLQRALALGQVRTIGGYTPGDGDSFFQVDARPDGSIPDNAEGWALIPKGHEVVVEMHYSPTGRPQRDQSRVAFKFGRAPRVTPPEDSRASKLAAAGQTETQSRSAAMGLVPLTAARHRAEILADADWVIPPGAVDFMVESRLLFSEDVTLYFLRPHMHWRGRSMRVWAELPNGNQEVLLDVPRYSFDWQYIYRLAEPRHLPRGTRIRARSTYDNSVANRYNPDPTAVVVAGPQSWDEMHVLVVGYVADDPLVDQRREANQSQFASEMLAGYLSIGQVPAERQGKFLLQRGLCRERWGDLVGARADLEAAIAHDRTLVDALNQEARLAESQKDFAAALELLSRAVAIEPENRLLRRKRARLLERGNRLAECRADLEQLVATDRYDFEAQMRLARLDRIAGDLSSARARLDVLLGEIHPHYPKAFQERAQVALAEGNFAQAQRDLASALDEAPLLAFELGRLWVAHGRWEAAASMFAHATQIEPERAEPWAALAAATLQAYPDAPDRAVQPFREALLRKPGDLAITQQLATLLTQLNDDPEALALWRSLVARQRSAAACNAIAWILATSPDVELRDGAEAVAHSEEALRLAERPTAELRDTLAAALAEAGRFDEAQQAQRLVVEALAGDIEEKRARAAARLQQYQRHEAYHRARPKAP